MVRTQIYLTGSEQKALRVLSKKLGRSQSELIREGVDLLISLHEKDTKVAAMRKARDLWKDRDDLDASELRKSWERF